MPTDGTRQTVYLAADLPGMNINFLDVDDKAVPTKGRMLDHIGFEVRDLEAFTRKLAANGVNLVQPYRRNSGDAIATALLVDPWGTSIELTEGLRGVPQTISACRSETWFRFTELRGAVSISFRTPCKRAFQHAGYRDEEPLEVLKGHEVRWCWKIARMSSAT